MRLLLACAASLAIAAPAHATWRQASSEHFLIYSEQSPQALGHFAEELERFDQAVRLVRGMSDQPPSLGNRVTIFDVGQQTLEAVSGDRSGNLRGYYHGNVSGSVAFITRNNPMSFEVETGQLLRKSNNAEMKADTVLLHEYAHHLMYQNLATPYPEWLIEGFAEFMSTAEFAPDGSVGIGLPAMHRFGGLIYGDQLPLETLFGGKFDKLNDEQRESVYGKGWLLTHYLTFEPSRRGQLEAYVAAIARGVDPVAAAHQSFGDFNALQKDLNSYWHRAQMKLPHLQIPAKDLHPVKVEITTLNAGAAAALPILMYLNSGVDQNSKALAAQARTIEQRFPGEPLVETTAAAAEIDSKEYANAEAAAQRALAADPRSTAAMILEGRAKIGQLASAGGSAAAFDEARAWYLKANKIDPEDPEPLYRFYDSFIQQKVAPTANAVAALHYASDLAPQDLGVRVQSASMYLAAGKLKEARAALVPVAFDPHGEKVTEVARKMVADIDAGDSTAALAAAGSKPAERPGS